MHYPFVCKESVRAASVLGFFGVIGHSTDVVLKALIETMQTRAASKDESTFVSNADLL